MIGLGQPATETTPPPLGACAVNGTIGPNCTAEHGNNTTRCAVVILPSVWEAVGGPDLAAEVAGAASPWCTVLVPFAGGGELMIAINAEIAAAASEVSSNATRPDFGAFAFATTAASVFGFNGLALEAALGGASSVAVLAAESCTARDGSRMGGLDLLEVVLERTLASGLEATGDSGERLIDLVAEADADVVLFCAGRSMTAGQVADWTKALLTADYAPRALAIAAPGVDPASVVAILAAETTWGDDRVDATVADGIAFLTPWSAAVTGDGFSSPSMASPAAFAASFEALYDKAELPSVEAAGVYALLEAWDAGRLTGLTPECVAAGAGYSVGQSVVGPLRFDGQGRSEAPPLVLQTAWNATTLTLDLGLVAAGVGSGYESNRLVYPRLRQGYDDRFRFLARVTFWTTLALSVAAVAAVLVASLCGTRRHAPSRCEACCRIHGGFGLAVRHGSGILFLGAAVAAAVDAPTDAVCMLRLWLLGLAGAGGSGLLFSRALALRSLLADAARIQAEAVAAAGERARGRKAVVGGGIAGEADTALESDEAALLVMVGRSEYLHPVHLGRIGNDDYLCTVAGLFEGTRRGAEMFFFFGKTFSLFL